MHTPALTPAARDGLLAAMRAEAAEAAMHHAHMFDLWDLAAVAHDTEFSSGDTLLEGEIVLIEPDPKVILGSPTTVSTWSPHTGYTVGCPPENLLPVRTIDTSARGDFW